MSFSYQNNRNRNSSYRDCVICTCTFCKVSEENIGFQKINRRNIEDTFLFTSSSDNQYEENSREYEIVFAKNPAQLESYRRIKHSQRDYG